MLMAVNEPYALMVQPDDILISPREVDEHFGTMVCFHPRYALGDHHNYMDKDDFLREMYLDTVGHDEAGMKRYERMVNIVSSRFRHGPKTEERAIDEAMQKVISEKYLMLPLYLYDHSGLAMSTESFSGRAPHAEWDSGQVGWIYVSKEDALKEFDADKMTGAIRQKADALMRSEVAAYDSYLHGECYGFELYKNGELSDSCWGFMGNFSDVLKDMAEYLPDECKGMVDHLEEQERPATIIKTLLKHAKIQVDQAAKAFEHASRQPVKSYFHIINTDFIRKEDALAGRSRTTNGFCFYTGSKTVRAGTACGYCCGTPKDGTGTHNAKSRAQQHEAADL